MKRGAFVILAGLVLGSIGVVLTLVSDDLTFVSWGIYLFSILALVGVVMLGAGLIAHLTRRR